MDDNLLNDLNTIDQILHAVKDQGLGYLNKLDTRATIPQTHSNCSSELPQDGLGAQETLKYFNEKFEPIMVATSGPRYWGYVIGGTTPAAIAGDWLTTIYDPNSFSINGDGDVSTLIELETIQLLLELFDLPKTFFGGFVSGATMSNFTALAVARQWIGKQFGINYALEGIKAPIKMITATPHSSVIKCLSMLGLGSQSLIYVGTANGNREAINIQDLKDRLERIREEPFILITSAGTVNSTDFDDFEAIAKLRSKYNFWWHIDAAFGGFAACSAKYRHLVAGWEHADSITIDCHKWLNVPYESAVFFIKEKHKVIQKETFQNSDAPYLEGDEEDFGYLNFIPENSRRLKALPVWFTLNAYGKKGYEYIVNNSTERALQLVSYLEASKHYKILAPVRLNTVCFTLEEAELTEGFLHKLNSTGQVYMSPTRYQGKKCIRAAFVNWRTGEDDVDQVIKIMEELAVTDADQLSQH